MKSEIQEGMINSKRVLRMVSKAQSLRYKQLYDTFNKLFNEDQALLPTNHIKLQYVVSTDFLASWKVFCTSDDDYRLIPLQMNSTLYYEEGVLRMGLKQKYDYQLLSLKTFQVLREFHSKHEIKRSAVKINQEKIIVSAKIYSYIVILKKDLKCIDQKIKKRQDFSLKQIKKAENLTARELVQSIIKQENYDNNYEGRLWKVQQKQNLDSLFKYLKQAADRANYQYRIKGFGQRIDPEQALYNLQVQQRDFFIVELKEKMQKWSMLIQSQKKCEGCYDMQQLKFPCLCQKVVYCTNECREKDKRFHIRLCTQVQKEEKSAVEGKKIPTNPQIQPQQILHKIFRWQKSQISNKFEQSKTRLKSMLEATIQQLQALLADSLHKIQDLQRKNMNMLIRCNLQSQKLQLQQAKSRAMISELQIKIQSLQFQQQELKHIKQIRQRSIAFLQQKCQDMQQKNNLLTAEIAELKQRMHKEDKRKEEIASSLKFNKQFYELMYENQVRDEILELLSKQEVYSLEQLRSCSQPLLAAVGIPIGQILKLKKL